MVDINAKIHGGCCRLRLFVVVGDASRKTRFPPCRRRHPQRHALHDDNSRHGSKIGLWPFKKAAFGGKKNSSLCSSIYMTLPKDNKVIIFLYRRSRTFFTANGGLFVFAAFQPAIGQARMGVAGNIRELVLEISPDTHGRIGRSPEKPQIFLCLFVVVYSRIKENTLQVTPMAKRNSYRVAILVGRLPRVAGFTLPPP